MSTLPVQQALARALQHHQAGQLGEAEALYRQILAAQPRHAEALHLLGVVAHQVGRHETAVALIRQSLAFSPANPAAHSNLGEAYRVLGRQEEAVACYRRAAEVDPQYAPAYFNLANVLGARGEGEEAVTAYRRALQINPGHAEAHNNLAMALADQRRFDEAVAAYGEALRLKPDYVEARINLGNALRDQGQLEAAVAAYGRALELQPDFAEAHNNLANAFKDLGQLDEAVLAYRRAIELKPDFAEAHHNLGQTLNQRGEWEEAITAYRQAIHCKPDHAQACLSLGNVLREHSQVREAIAAYRQALQRQPDNPDTHNNLGLALVERGDFDEGIAAYRQALQLSPDLAETHNNLGAALARQGRLDDTLAAFRRVVALKPEHAGMHSNLIYALHFQSPASAEAIVQEQSRWSRQFGDSLAPFIRPHPHDRSPGRRLRLGYVSPDFRDHVVGRNLLPLFRHHHREQFEILCYSNVFRPDRVTEDFRRLAAGWRDATSLADEALAEKIREDGVDILVDLTQHMAGNRLPVFARQPAPVQVSFAGYPEGTGLAAIAYRISDRYLESEIGAELRTSISDLRPGEQVSLLDSFWCYDPCGVEAAVNGLPADENGWVTFGCLNNTGKVNKSALLVWARVLKNVADSRLLLLSPAGSHRQRTVEKLAQQGIAAHRIEFVEICERQAYLELYHRIDIALDPFPYGGHTTSLDALWMGVPVVSLAGQPAVSRAGLSQLSHLGLPELVAFAEDDYVATAARLAGDLPRLAALRATLRPRMAASPLMDAAHFARGIEAAYRTMWKRWCAQPQLR